MRIAVVPTAALDVGGFGLDDPKALAAAVGVAAAGVAAYVSRSNTAAQVPALRWDDNARWLETCKAKGVVSWYDAGLRLTASETPAPTPAPAPAPAPYLAPSPVAKKAPAPPTEAERSTAARMAAVAKVLAETTIPRVGVRPSRRAWSGSPYGLHTPPIPKKSYKSLFDPERPFWARRIAAVREVSRQQARRRAEDKARDELLEAAWLRHVEGSSRRAEGSSRAVRLISRAVRLIDTRLINSHTASRKNKTFIQTFICE